jgi:hypothetical protein
MQRICVWAVHRTMNCKCIITILIFGIDCIQTKIMQDLRLLLLLLLLLL